MGWDITLENDSGEAVEVPEFSAGSTHNIFGDCYADICVTFNYAEWFYKTLDKEEGLRWLDNKTGEETLPRIIGAVGCLNEMGGKASDYWESTPANAKQILLLFMAWAMQHPEARWRF